MKSSMKTENNTAEQLQNKNDLERIWAVLTPKPESNSLGTMI